MLYCIFFSFPNILENESITPKAIKICHYSVHWHKKRILLTNLINVFDKFINHTAYSYREVYYQNKPLMDKTDIHILCMTCIHFLPDFMTDFVVNLISTKKHNKYIFHGWDRKKLKIRNFIRMTVFISTELVNKI